MNKNSNTYTFIFAVLMVLVVASVLAFTATSLQPTQDRNVRQETMQNILFTVGVDSVEVDGKLEYLSRPLAENNFDKYIKETIALNPDGSVNESVDAFNVDLSKELNKPVDKQVYPLYIAEVKQEKYYIVPLRGTGLWGAIWGYISLKDDVNTVKGVIFDHKSETAGLGGEITKMWFRQRFEDEKIFDSNGELVGVSVVKGYSGGGDKDDNKIDAISGATITGDGVSDMISERLKHYLPYFKEQTEMKVATK